MDASEFASALTKDPPFAYPDPDSRTRSILLETSSVKLYKIVEANASGHLVE